jgi:phage-related protein
MNVAMSANPIGILIVAIGALVAAIIYLWNKNKAFRDFFINAWNGIKSFFSGLPATFSKIGKAIVDGIMNGLKAAWDNLTGWLGNAVDGLVSGVKNALGIHSPSKVFEGIGGNTADGFARGIEKGRKRVVAAAKATASSAAKAAQASFDRSESMRFANIKAAQGKATDPWAAFDAVTPKPETAAQKAATAAKDLLKQIKDRAAAIMGSFGIGETAQPTTAASGTGLLAALQSQVQAKGNFINNIVALKKAGLAAGVISSLLAAGPAQAGTQASALAGLSSAQLSQYNTAFKTDSAFSTQLATMEKSNKGFKQVTVAPNAVQVTINGNADSTAVTAAVDSAFEKLLRELRSR